MVNFVDVTVQFVLDFPVRGGRVGRGALVGADRAGLAHFSLCFVSCGRCAMTVCRPYGAACPRVPESGWTDPKGCIRMINISLDISKTLKFRFWLILLSLTFQYQDRISATQQTSCSISHYDGTP